MLNGMMIIFLYFINKFHVLCLSMFSSCLYSCLISFSLKNLHIMIERIMFIHNDLYEKNNIKQQTLKRATNKFLGHIDINLSNISTFAIWSFFLISNQWKSLWLKNVFFEVISLWLTTVNNVYFFPFFSLWVSYKCLLCYQLNNDNEEKILNPD